MKKRISKTLFLIVLTFALLAAAICNMSGLKNRAFAAEGGKVYYVSPTAATGTAGEAGNREKPYNIYSLLTATDVLKPGDTVKVLPGTYDLVNDVIIRVSGSYDKYITIENESSTEQATLAFYGQRFGSANRGVEIYGNYIHWRDIDVCGAGDNGLYIGGSYNIVEDCEFYNNRDTGLQLGRANGELTTVEEWPSYNLIKNCTSHNNYDNETYGENADGFAAKLTVGYGNVFDGCIAYRNSDDGWDLYAKAESGNIGAVIIYNCVAFENGFIEYDQATNNARFPEYRTDYNEANTAKYDTRDGDGNGFKLGGSVMEGDVVLYNCLSFHNKMHGVTDNSNPGVLSITGVTSYDNARTIDNNPASATYGQVLATGGEACGDIDISRQTYSYNNLNKVLSIKSSVKGLDDDLYRASVTDSILNTKSDGAKAYKIVGSLDADSKNNIKGTEINAPKADEVFETLPALYASNTYNISGLKDLNNGENRIHLKYRNADGSINMGGILAVKDYSKLLGNDNKIGSVLNLTSYAAYTHFGFDNDYTGVTSENAAIVKAAKEVLTVSCNPGAVYQNIWVATNMKGVKISWASSNASVLTVSDQTKTSISKTDFCLLVVTRDIEEDKVVKLTATITAGDQKDTKEFTLTVKKDEPRIGDIYVTTADGDRIYNGKSIILNQFAVSTEPTLAVVNGANYSGLQFVQGSQFDVETTYQYATDKNSNYVEVKQFAPSNAGVWHITHVVTLKSSKEVKSYDYYIYTASTVAKVDFVGKSNVTVNVDGFTVSGELSNVTGTIYAVSSATELTVTADNIKSMAGVQSFSFTSDKLLCQFINGNSASYHVYYALANMRDEITSQIYSADIDVVEISTTENFIKVATGEKVGDETIERTIYTLTKCLDFSETTWTYPKSAKPFTGLLDGKGHTVSNIKVSGAGLFSEVKGGAIINLCFDNIVVDNGSNQRTGVIVAAYGGSFANIALTNISVVGGQRTGGFIGQIFEGAVPTTITNVSLVNPIPELNENGSLKAVEEGTQLYYIKANGNRVGGLVGFIQPTADPKTALEVVIRDCYVSTYTWSTGYSIGGFVGEYDDSKGKTMDMSFKLELYNCYTTSTLVGTGTSSRIGGMLGYHQGGVNLKINSCLSLPTIYFSNLPVTAAQKNISCIIGNFAATGDSISNCGSLFDEYNTDFGVTTYETNLLESDVGKNILTGTLGFKEDVWTVIYKDGGTTIPAAPFLTLKFKGACSCAK